LRRHQHFLAWPPVPRIHLEVSNRPGFIIDKEILHVTNIAIRGLDVITRHLVGAAQM
jgi:hypothetical protein